MVLVYGGVEFHDGFSGRTGCLFVCTGELEGWFGEYRG